jgi:uncharacterized protein (DUF58 family)
MSRTALADYLGDFAAQLRAATERDLEVHPARRRPLRMDETENHHSRPEPYASKWKEKKRSDEI